MNTKPTVTYRPAKPEDAKTAGRLLFDTFADEVTYIYGLDSEERAKKILTKLFCIRGHRLSYEFTEMILLNGSPAGLIVSIPGKMVSKMNYKFGRFVLKQYRLRGKIAVITRAYSDLFIKEAEKDELHLANLAVKPRNRGKGIGSQALTYFEQKARQAGFSKVSLAVDINNQKARQLYERLGYQVKAMNVAPKKRAQHSISGSLRMVKDLDHEG